MFQKLKLQTHTNMNKIDQYPSITAFMQNPWFPLGTDLKHIEMYTTNQEFHRRILARSMSGGRLVQAFGPELFNKIWWDNVAPVAADHSSGVTEVDNNHVAVIVEKTKPDLIITFGVIAMGAIHRCLYADGIQKMNCHHPNARHRTAAELADFAIRVQGWVDDWKIKQNDHNHIRTTRNR